MTVTREEAGRDISAALSDIRGRRDQTVGEFDERLRLLEQLSSALEAGTLEPKAAQDRVRRLVHERSAKSSRPVRAGRTKIGIRMPAEATPAAPRGMPMRTPLGPSPAGVAASIHKALGSLDGRMVSLLTESMSEGDRREARLELALLRSVRASLARQLESMPNDVVLLGSVIEFAEDVQQTLRDLSAGGSGRVKRLLDYDRELASKLASLGASVSTVKEQLKKAQGLLGTDEKTLARALREAVTAFDSLSGELKRRFADSDQSFLDQLL